MRQEKNRGQCSLFTSAPGLKTRLTRKVCDCCFILRTAVSMHSVKIQIDSVECDYYCWVRPTGGGRCKREGYRGGEEVGIPNDRNAERSAYFVAGNCLIRDSVRNCPVKLGFQSLEYGVLLPPL